MKIASIDNPVRASWLVEQGLRLDADTYVSDGYQTRKFIESLRNFRPLSEITERIFHPGIFRRHWTTDLAYGIPFLGSAAIFQADLSNLPLITSRSFNKRPQLRLEPGWSLITRSGMTAGRVTYARLEMEGLACSEDVLRVVADEEEISPGYLYTFLASRYGLAMIKGQVYGTSVKHIEPEQIADLPVLRLPQEIEFTIDGLITEAMQLRLNFNQGIVGATDLLFECAGLSDLATLQWHRERDLDFFISGANATSLRAMNFSPRAQRIISRIQERPHRTLAKICQGGQFDRGSRFTRVDSDPEKGFRLLGQRQGFWLRPEGRWVALKPAEEYMVRAKDESILVASQGTLGENEAFCRAIFVTGRWQRNYVFSEHFLRITSGDPEIPGAYLFAFLRSEAMFRVLRSMSTGSKQQDIHEELRRDIPVPLCTPEDRHRIAEMVRQAYRWRDEADMKEDEALALLEQAVRKAAR
ncbi:restriction endonuclease subunit S [Actinomadura sp. K4S16]|uniref:methylation-associated defense system restriction endonuclease subunit S MAD5 n=1 Tax=Actinomadura sp. K4S16 TaxID=1316147 RepID=UPI0011F04772|nr:restriction endonuclease subunit S [Actinomadura sp. K4S16]